MKKTLMVLLAMSLACIMAVGSTMSYLTYIDYDVNTMEVGNVKIEQVEQYRDRNGALTDWGNGDHSPGFYPVVCHGQGSTLLSQTVPINDVAYDLYDTEQNVVDKIVSINNTGSQDAFVRTVFAFEMKKIEQKDDAGNVISTTWVNPVGDEVVLNVNPSLSISFGTTEVVVYKDANGEFTTDSAGAASAYVIGLCQYDTALEKNTTSAPSLLQVYLASDVNNEFYDAVGDQYEILVLSQAVQTMGFEGENAASNALTEAFGDFNAEKAASWFKEVTK